MESLRKLISHEIAWRSKWESELGDERDALRVQVKTLEDATHRSRCDVLDANLRRIAVPIAIIRRLLAKLADRLERRARLDFGMDINDEAGRTGEVLVVIAAELRALSETFE